jgi:folate-binding protein YgfZ
LVRIENGRPRYGDDIRDTTLPQESQQMHAVSFNKGCYIGQEIVERIRAMGHVNKKLMRVELEGDAIPGAGTKTTVSGNEAEITLPPSPPKPAKSRARIRSGAAIKNAAPRYPELLEIVLALNCVNYDPRRCGCGWKEFYEAFCPTLSDWCVRRRAGVRAG